MGAVQVSVAEPFATSLTVMENEDNEVVALPSLTRITMFEYVPTCALVGVPDKRPVDVLKLAHAGLLEILNVNESPFASFAVGVKAYALPTPTDVEGVPEMVGAVLLVEPEVTPIANAGSEVVALPSLTRMTMFENVPTLELVGVPAKRPVDVLNVAHTGLLEMLNVSLSPFASLALGVKAYAVPTFAELLGVPEMVGARFVVEELVAVIANSGNERYLWPSPTVILMLPHRPVYDGFPVSVPVVVEKLAQYGLFVT